MPVFHSSNSSRCQDWMAAHDGYARWPAVRVNHDEQLDAAYDAKVMPLEHDGGSLFNAPRHLIGTEMNWLLVAGGHVLADGETT